MKELNKVEVQDVNGGFIGLFEGIFGPWEDFDERYLP